MEQGDALDRRPCAELTCGSAPHLPAVRYRTRTFSLYISMSTPYTPDLRIPVRRLQLGISSGTLGDAPRKKLFLRGPVPLEWLRQAADLPGKTLNVAIALWWQHGMSKGKPIKLTQTALRYLNVERDAASAGLARLELAGLVEVERKPGQRPSISILTCIQEVDSE